MALKDLRALGMTLLPVGLACVASGVKSSAQTLSKLDAFALHSGESIAFRWREVRLSCSVESDGRMQSLKDGLEVLKYCATALYQIRDYTERTQPDYEPIADHVVQAFSLISGESLLMHDRMFTPRPLALIRYWEGIPSTFYRAIGTFGDDMSPSYKCLSKTAMEDIYNDPQTGLSLTVTRNESGCDTGLFVYSPEGMCLHRTTLAYFTPESKTPSLIGTATFDSHGCRVHTGVWLALEADEPDQDSWGKLPQGASLVDGRNPTAPLSQITDRELDLEAALSWTNHPESRASNVVHRPARATLALAGICIVFAIVFMRRRKDGSVPACAFAILLCPAQDHELYPGFYGDAEALAIQVAPAPHCVDSRAHSFQVSVDWPSKRTFAMPLPEDAVLTFEMLPRDLAYLQSIPTCKECGYTATGPLSLGYAYKELNGMTDPFILPPAVEFTLTRRGGSTRMQSKFTIHSLGTEDSTLEYVTDGCPITMEPSLPLRITPSGVEVTISWDPHAPIDLERIGFCFVSDNGRRQLVKAIVREKLAPVTLAEMGDSAPPLQVIDLRGGAALLTYARIESCSPCVEPEAIIEETGRFVWTTHEKEFAKSSHACTGITFECFLQNDPEPYFRHARILHRSIVAGNSSGIAVLNGAFMPGERGLVVQLDRRAPRFALAFPDRIPGCEGLVLAGGGEVVGTFNAGLMDFEAVVATAGPNDKALEVIVSGRIEPQVAAHLPRWSALRSMSQEQ